MTTMDPDVESRYEHNGRVMVGTAILLVILILFIVSFHAYLRFCRRRRLFNHPLPLTSTAPSTKEQSLHPSLLKSLPTFAFSSATHHHDCAVCLSDFADGDQARLLPNCNHAFHTDCIDTWFGSHSNCPLCRTPVQPATVSESETGPGEGCSSSLPPPVGYPRKPLSINVEVPDVDRGLDPVTGDQGFRWSLKRFCTV
ncbi:hypothetical protein RJT34_19385 [Clitoria ternatea]|uniref:RING-type domain-containing protein n=1 Tax=Clitoria ternatea TaxID=43366 RepID=A0AAN9IQX6_CLITE